MQSTLPKAVFLPRLRGREELARQMTTQNTAMFYHLPHFVFGFGELGAGGYDLEANV